MADLHVLEDEIGESPAWMSDLSGLEQFLAKHAAFLDYLDAREG